MSSEDITLRWGLRSCFRSVWDHDGASVSYTLNNTLRLWAFSTTAGFYFAKEDTPSSEFNDWGTVNLSLLNIQVETHIIDTNTVILPFLTGDPCELVRLIVKKQSNDVHTVYICLLSFNGGFIWYYNTCRP